MQLLPQFVPSDLQRRLFERTFRHPVVGSLTEWVPTEWLLALANPTPTNVTDLGTWAPDAALVGMDALFHDLLAKGMRDPFLVGVGRVTRRVRLEAGNHRVRLCLQKGISHVPAVAYVGDSSVTHPGNGLHQGALLELQLPEATDIMGPYPVKEYMRLSHVLTRPPCFFDTGL